MSKNNCSNRDNGALLAIKIEFKNNILRSLHERQAFIIEIFSSPNLHKIFPNSYAVL
mgnify:CR=1 FL=1